MSLKIGAQKSRPSNGLFFRVFEGSGFSSQVIKLDRFAESGLSKSKSIVKQTLSGFNLDGQVAIAFFSDCNAIVFFW